MSEESNSPVEKQGGAHLNREIQARIGHQLRALYDDVVRQGVPDRFADLIHKLDSSQPDNGDARPQEGPKEEGSN